MQERTQVIIVGGGPVGHALAIELGQRGVATTLIERHRRPVRIPKGQNLTNRTLEHFHFWNCVEELRAARVTPQDYPIGGITAYRNLMSPYWHKRGIGRATPVSEYYFQANERLPQYCTEAVLRARVAALPSVTTLYGRAARSVEDTADGVRVTIGEAREGASFYSWSADAQDATDTGTTAEVLEADFLVGCDGGRSLVRESMGIDRAGRDFDQRMVLAVLRSPELHARLKRFPDCVTYRVLKPELKGYWQFFGRIDVGESFFFHAPVPKDTRPDNFDFQALLHDAAGFAFDAEIEHLGFWDLRIMVASQYAGGNIFIAGDAAHQHPPYGGFGLNTGLEDAANLGWKLAARLQGWGGDALLGSYHLERQPIMVETGEAMISGGIERDRAWLEKVNPERDRAAFEMVWQALPEDERNAMARSYEPHYQGSPVVMGPAGGVSSIHGAHSHAAEAGHHLSPRMLSWGRNVYEELGSGFTLLALDADDSTVSAFTDAAGWLGVPLTVVRDSYEEPRTAYAARLILVRPDQYVAWAGEKPADARAILGRVIGRETA